MRIFLSRTEGEKFGFRFAGENTESSVLGGCFVDNVIYDSPAARAGLQVGDKLVAVDDKGVIALSHADTYALINACGLSSVLTVVRLGRSQFEEVADAATQPGSLQQSSSSSDSQSPTKLLSKRMTIKSLHPLRPSSVETTGELLVIELFARNNRLGFKWAGGDDSTKLGGVFVTEVDPSGVAAESSEAAHRLHRGDRILEVNGVTLINATQAHAQRLLEKSLPHVKLTVMRIGDVAWAKLCDDTELSRSPSDRAQPLHDEVQKMMSPFDPVEPALQEPDSPHQDSAVSDQQLPTKPASESRRSSRTSLLEPIPEKEPLTRFASILPPSSPLSESSRTRDLHESSISYASETIQVSIPPDVLYNDAMSSPIGLMYSRSFSPYPIVWGVSPLLLDWLVPGDQIVDVSGQECFGLTIEALLQIINSSASQANGSDVPFRIRREPENAVIRTVEIQAFESFSVSSHSSTSRFGFTYQSHVTDPGFVIVTSVSSSIPHNTLFVGDQIIEINEIPIFGEDCGECCF
jgi:hypothetical protein